MDLPQLNAAMDQLIAEAQEHILALTANNRLLNEIHAQRVPLLMQGLGQGAPAERGLAPGGLAARLAGPAIPALPLPPVLPALPGTPSRFSQDGTPLAVCQSCSIPRKFHPGRAYCQTESEKLAMQEWWSQAM